MFNLPKMKQKKEIVISIIVIKIKYYRYLYKCILKHELCLKHSTNFNKNLMTYEEHFFN